MPEQHVFEYAVLRVVPKVEREEFINVGVILHCGPLHFLGVRWNMDEKLLKTFSPDLDIEEVRANLCAFDVISRGGADGGTIGLLDMAGRFRWLTATRSTILQPSSVHPGYTSDPQSTLDRLFEQMVVR
jgi:hypothetical protein